MSIPSYSDFEPEVFPDAKSYGEKLLSVRTEQSLSIAEVAKRMKLDPVMIAAMEAGELDRLPRDLFGKGYLKGYARLLGLKDEDAARVYDITMHAGGQIDFVPLENRSAPPVEGSDSMPIGLKAGVGGVVAVFFLVMISVLV